MKRLYSRTNKIKAVQQISKHETRERKIKAIDDRVKHEKATIERAVLEHGDALDTILSPTADSSRTTSKVAKLKKKPKPKIYSLDERYHIGDSKKDYMDIYRFAYASNDDIALKVSLLCFAM